MNKSYISIVNEELTKILKSGSSKLKLLLFNYPVVMPVAKIVFTNEFRNEIIKYINSNEFIRIYTGHLPTQYSCAFETIRKNDIDILLKGKSFKDLYNDVKEERLLSIRLIKDQKIREDFINYNVFSIGISDIDELKEFVVVLKREFKGLKLPKIEKQIKELEVFKSYGLNEYEILNFKKTKIFLKKDCVSSVAFIKDDKVNFIAYPFNKIDLNIYFLEESESFLKFLELLMPVILKMNNILEIDNYKTLLNFIRYQKTIHWGTRIETGSILNFALKILFDVSLENSKIIIQWIKNQREVRNKKFEVADNFDKQKFILKVATSKLSVFEKLYLTYLIGEKSDYENLIIPTIESMKVTKSEKKIDEIRDLLYYVL